ncbi:MAG TPA: hypothetical protein VM283_03825, partial [Armatimonadota bacterium]|nr:hypothetical protein [Armatimonadota bacterium]
LTSLVENIPYARWEWKARGADAVAGETREGETEAQSFRIVDSTGAGVAFALDEPHGLRLVPEGLKTSGWRRLQIGRVEIALPARMSAGESAELAYVIRPVSGTD